MSDAPREMTRAEKAVNLAKHGFLVAADGTIICGVCGRGVVYLEDAEPGGWVAIGCPSDPMVRMLTTKAVS